MIAVDTNVLVRLVVGDDQEQVGRVVTLLERTREAGDQWLVTVPVVCELVWVLDSVFDVPRREIASTLEALLGERLYEVDNRDAVGEAIERYTRGRGDFADYLIAALGRSARGCRAVATWRRWIPDSRRRLPVTTRDP